MERITTIATIIIVTIALVFVALHVTQRREFRQELASMTDMEYIAANLTARAADDCVLTKMSDGVWACKEIKTGKLFIVRRP